MGGRAYEVLELTRENQTTRNVICSCDPVLEAEIRFVVRKEMVRNLGDLQRRTRLSLGPCQGTQCLMMASQILSEELGWTTDQAFAEVRKALEKRWKAKVPLLEGTGLQQEELLGRTYFNVGGLNNF